MKREKEGKERGEKIGKKGQMEERKVDVKYDIMTQILAFKIYDYQY